MLLHRPTGVVGLGEVVMNDIRGGVLSPWLQRRRLKMGPAYLRGRVLDYGCSDGRLAAICRPKAYLGVDINVRALAQARAAHPGFRFATSVSDRKRFQELAGDAGLLVETYRRFLFGANQLVVLRRAGEPGVSKAA